MKYYYLKIEKKIPKMVYYNKKYISCFHHYFTQNEHY